ncbi:MAG: hypothetical protein HQK78_00705 [Desulfobacterales bacterium]|nr:hypothetical protein [Desulfobacterales bacterium]
MITDVVTFAKQLKEDGIVAGREEAEKIILEAKNKADQIIEEANNLSQKLKIEAEDEIGRRKKRSEAELKLAARDLILNVKGSIENIAFALLKEKVSEVLSSEEVIKSALIEVIKTQKAGRDWELSLGTAIGKPLSKVVVEDLFKKAGAKVKVSEGFKKAGFELKSLSGTEVIEISDESMTETFRRLLSPELQKIIDSK